MNTGLKMIYAAVYAAKVLEGLKNTPGFCYKPTEEAKKIWKDYNLSVRVSAAEAAAYEAKHFQNIFEAIEDGFGRHGVVYETAEEILDD